MPAKDRILTPRIGVSVTPLFHFELAKNGKPRSIFLCFVISEPADLDENHVYAKERRLIEEIKCELAKGRNVQVFAVYTRKRDVTRRLQNLLLKEGIRVEVLTAETPPEQREAWYERQLRNGMQVCVCHPKLVQTGLDYVEYEPRRRSPLSVETSPLFADSGSQRVREPTISVTGKPVPVTRAVRRYSINAEGFTIRNTDAQYVAGWEKQDLRSTFVMSD